MANIKNFGLVGVGSTVQFGKGGTTFASADGIFAAKNANGSAFVKVQVADPTVADDAVTLRYLNSAIANVSSNTSALQAEVDAIEASVGLAANGAYIPFSGSNYMDGASSITGALTFLDSALFNANAALSGRIDNTQSWLASNVSAIYSTINAVNTAYTAADTQIYSDYRSEIASNVSTIRGEINSNVAVINQTFLDVNAAYIAADNAVLSAAYAYTDNAVIAASNAYVAADAVVLATARSEIASNVAVLNQTIADVNTAYIAADAVVLGTARSELASNVAVINQTFLDVNAAYVAADAVVLGTARSELASNVATLNNSINAVTTAWTANAASQQGDIVALYANAVAQQTEIDAIELGVGLNADGTFAPFTTTNYVNNSTSIANAISMLDTNVKGVWDSVVALGNAFNYIGTLAGGANAGVAYDMTSLPAGGKDAGDYYKVSVAGYFNDGTTTFYANVNDGLVWNTTGSVDKIDNTDATSTGTAGRISVVGSTDTGYTIDIDASYAGQTSITTLGTVTTGTWNATTIATTKGGTGLTTIGTSKQVLRTNAGATGLEYADLIATDVAFTSANLASTNVGAALEELYGLSGANLNSVWTAMDANVAMLRGEINSNVSTLYTYIDAKDAAINAAYVAADAVVLSTARSELASNVAVINQTFLDVNAAYVAADAVVLGTARSELASNVATLNASINAVTTAWTANAAAQEAEIVDLYANAASQAADLTTLFANAVAQQAAIDAMGAAWLANAAAQQTEIDAIELGAGLGTNGTYTANANGIYISGATSLFDADNKLDAALYTVSQTLANLSQNSITSGTYAVNTTASAIEFRGPSGLGVFGTMVSNASTNSQFQFDMGTANEVTLKAVAGAGDVDLHLVPQGAGQVVIGSAGDAVVQASDTYKLTLAGGDNTGGVGGNLVIKGGASSSGASNVFIQDGAGNTIATFNAGNAGAGFVLAGAATSATLSVAGTATNADLVLAPKGTGVVSASSAKISNVANATAAQDAVTLSQMNAAIVTGNVGHVVTRVVSISETTGSVNIGALVTGTVMRVKVVFDNAWNNASTLTVGSTGTSAASLVAVADTDPSTAGIYLVEVATDVSADQLTATISAGGTGGTGKVYVEFIQG